MEAGGWISSLSSAQPHTPVCYTLLKYAGEKGPLTQVPPWPRAQHLQAGKLSHRSWCSGPRQDFIKLVLLEPVCPMFHSCRK